MSIKDLRHKTGLSQRKFADMYKFSVRQVQSWEQGQRETPECILYMLNRLLAIDFPNVFSMEDCNMKRFVKDQTYVSAMAKESSRGVFWLIDGEICAYPFLEDSVDGVAKSGNTYNHKKLWEYVKPRGCNKPFNYYPRGRVDFNGKDKPVIYMNPNIDDKYISDLMVQFGLREKPIIHYDYSDHYKCYLDDGYKPQK